MATTEGAVRLLVVSHDGARTGAPISLAHLAQVWSGDDRIELTVLLATGGPLEQTFRDFGACVVVLPRRLHWAVQGRRSRAIRALRRAWLKRHVGPQDVAYVNTATLGSLMTDLRQLAQVQFCHVHEMAHWLATRVDGGEMAQVLQATDYFIACSRPVASTLEQVYAVPAARIRVEPETIPPPAMASATDVARVRVELGIPASARIVGGVGTTDLRKGFDLFLWIADALRRLDNTDPVHFVWLGKHNEQQLVEWVRRDAQMLGLGDRVHLPGEMADPTPLVQAFSAMALTSREDPYPLVMLEAASLGVPIVAFAGTGGADDFLARGGGHLVPYGDFAGFAKALHDVLELSEDDRVRLSDIARRRVVEGHRPDAAASRIVDDILLALTKSRASIT